MPDHNRRRVVVVTGASAGIGLAAAKALAATGWRVIALGRDPARTASAEEQIRAVAANGGSVEMHLGDLSLMADAARLAREVAARTGKIDVLLNNAGGIAAAQRVTPEGNEATFAGNHLGHFLFTAQLLPLLRAAAADQPKGAVRIINVSSHGHHQSTGLDFDDLQSLKSFTTLSAYANVKLSNILFTRMLAKRLAADGIISHAMCPGLVATNFASHGGESTQRYYESKKDVSLSPEAGADTLIWLATEAEPGETTGGYFQKRAPAAVSAYATDEAAERLWEESEKLLRQ